MRLLVSWLREFVDVPATPDDIAGRLGLRGFEVAAVEPLGAGDAVIDFEITANRPDCLSVLGLAREVATAYDVPIRLPSSDGAGGPLLRPAAVGRSDRLTVAIEADDLCPRYAAAIVEVTVAASPAWLTRRLEATGIRPISNIVDITNYVLIELGQALHAFDLQRLAGAEIRVRRARPGETIRTLDGVERKLEPDMLVIADRDRAQAVAGVMGGAASEVSKPTTVVAIESAYFQPVTVRKTSRRLGLKTEASSRFERGSDISAPVLALQRALALIEQLDAGRVVEPLVDCYPRPREPRVVHLRADRLARLLGAIVPADDVERILTGLGLAVVPAVDGWDVTVPTFRVDLLREADLVEEVGRHFGFDRLEPTFPAVTDIAPAPDPRVPRDQLVRRTLTAAGLSEAVTFGFIEASAVAAFGVSAGDTVAIANPLSAKFDTLRPSLLPGLVDAVGHNRNHGRRDVALFEIGATFAASGESRRVAIAWTGSASGEHWSGGARDVDFFDVKGAVEQLSEVLAVPIRWQPASPPHLVGGQAAAVLAAQGEAADLEVGTVGVLAPAIADARGLPRQDRIVVAELDLDRLWRARVTSEETTRSLPRHPSVVRDLSIIVAERLPAEIIRGTIQAAGEGGRAPLASVGFFDRYQGKGIPAGAVSVSVRLTFQAADRTLTDADVQDSFDRIVAALGREHGARQR
jgi:phenylalanyl-tRNA synthetase beta chain